MTLAPNRIFDCEDVLAFDAPSFVIRACAVGVVVVGTDRVTALT
jgi:hypothetical protein